MIEEPDDIDAIGYSHDVITQSFAKDNSSSRRLLPSFRTRVKEITLDQILKVLQIDFHECLDD